MLRIIALAAVVTSLTGCVFAVGTDSDEWSQHVDCTVTIAEDNSVSINGECPSNMRLNVDRDPKTIEIETEHE